MIASTPARRPFSLALLIAEAKRRMRKRRLLVLAFVLAFGGVAAGASVTFTQSSALQRAGACPVTGGYYAYAIPDDPAHPPAAGSGAGSWGWTPRKHQVEVGDRLRLSGRLWKVTEIAAMPGVEAVGRPFGILGWQPPLSRHGSGTASLTMCGRLVFRPVG
jgi:hypothetical protein